MDLLIIQSLSLDFCKSELKTVKVKQYDKKSRFIEIICTENGKVRKLDTSFKCIFKMLTPDNRAIYDDATIKDDGTIIVELTETALAYPGTGNAEINIFDLDSDTLLSTKKFNIDIDGSVYPNDAVITSPEFNALTNMIFDVNESIETVNGFKDAENERKENEIKRVQSEITRENNSNIAISNVNSATTIAKEKIKEAEDRLDTLTTKIEECDITSEKAEKSAISAAESAKISSDKASAASKSESSALTSAKNAKTSETNAKNSETNSKVNEQNAKTSATNAKTSETNAEASAVTASTKATLASTAANNASASANTSSEQASAAERSAKESKSYAVGGTGIRNEESTDNAKYYKEQSQRIAEGLKGALIPMGTITFAELQNTSTLGYMYNISNEFTTTNRFKEGAGNVIPAGTNVYYTADGYWDCMAGSPVTGVKGSAESSYRRGNVNLTKANIGLGNVPDVATNDQTPTFAESTALNHLISGEKLSVAFGKIAKAITSLINHIGNKSNPHTVTKAQVGLGNVDNTSDVNKPVSTAQKSAIDGAKKTITDHANIAASASVLGHVKLINSCVNTSTTAAATSASVKTVYDLANSALNNLNSHKSSGDHDGRYYTEAEVNNLIGNINNRILDQNTESSYDLIMRRSTTNYGRNNSSYWFIKNGIFETSPQTEGAADWGAILVVKPYNDWIFQVWFLTNGHIYTRRNINGGGFTGWQTII